MADESQTDWDGAKCEVCGEECLWGSIHPKCSENYKKSNMLAVEKNFWKTVCDFVAKILGSYNGM